MLKYLFVLIVTFSYSILFAQNLSSKNIVELQHLKSQAIEIEDYQKAAFYKKYIEKKIAIQKAVEIENYELAALLKNEIKALENGEDANASEKVVADNSGIEFYNLIYLHDLSKGTYAPLEKKPTRQESKSYNAIYVAGTSNYLVVDGYTSTRQILPEQKAKFEVKVNKGIDPESLFRLFRLNVEGRDELKRKYLTSKSLNTAYAGGSSVTDNSNEIPISFIKLTSEVYEVQINKTLRPGEYAFQIGTTWHLFGLKHYTSFGDTPIKNESVTTKNAIYQNQKTTYLGVEYSLFKVRGDRYLGTESLSEIQLIEGTKVYDKEIRHHEVEKMFNKDKSIEYSPAFGRAYGNKNISKNWIITSGSDYNVDLKQIQNQIDNYDINKDGLGFVLIPILADVESQTLYSYFVWFDFNTRKILSYEYLDINSNIHKNLKRNYLGDDFYRHFKKYYAKFYKPNRF